MSTTAVETIMSEVQLTIETSVDVDRSPTEEESFSSDESDASSDEGEGSYESDNELEKAKAPMRKLFSEDLCLQKVLELSSLLLLYTIQLPNVLLSMVIEREAKNFYIYW
ncbi:uncharacterized protein LDX57_001836 [Aspergillus melleus]|uniref:uncharacterized protein n=1 Tax=Aspergillus melleus TaxID=138277 RepID=UPI001E8DAC1F|nr:uncharacterized protein LDX57_001836 [Aspergillus melleus]KAH8424079.1 hypothetical protein LDX57_001836 [Aspergillus melleus]